MGYRPASGLRFLVPVIGVRTSLLQSMERAARIHNAICSTKNYSIYCSLTGWTAPPPPASRKNYAISVRTSDFCWKTRLGGARQLGFCRARAAVYPADRESRTEMAHFFQRAALARNGKAGRCASPSLCVLRVALKLQQIEEFLVGYAPRWARRPRRLLASRFVTLSLAFYWMHNAPKRETS